MGLFAGLLSDLLIAFLVMEYLIQFAEFQFEMWPAGGPGIVVVGFVQN